MSQEHLSLQVDPNFKPKVCLLSFVGALDSFGLKLHRNEISSLISDFHGKFLILDFSKLEFINSEGIGLLLEINETLKTRNANLILVGAVKQVLDVLRVVGILETVRHYGELSECLTSIDNAE